VIDNLAKLIEAQRLIRKAEMLHRAGKLKTAQKVYQKASVLCPGSRYEMKAKAKLEEIRAKLAVIETVDPPAGVEIQIQVMPSQEYSEPYGPESHVPCVPMTIETEVAECLEACHRSFAAGCYVDAKAFAEEALLLDPACQAAQVVVGRICRLLHLGEDAEYDQCVPMPVEEECEEEGSAAEDPYGQSKWHCPPSVDPQVIEAWQKQLIEQMPIDIPYGNVEPAEPEDPEGRIEMPADWQYLDLYFEPEHCDKIADDQEPYEEPCHDSSGSDDPETKPNMPTMIHHLLHLLHQSGCCVEIDSGCVHAGGTRVWLQVGNCHCHWVTGDPNSGIVIIST
ncbi:MAG: hypothetical protein Q9M29_07745, partial [Mariprofundaceae bacterium]|nr:hypothetical protein [Mariprofundaceae bacterium]